MNRILLLIGLFFALILNSCTDNFDQTNEIKVTSPDQKLELTVFQGGNREVGYFLKRGEEWVVDSSYLGLSFVDQPVLQSNLKWNKQEITLHTESWTTTWGERRTVVDNYRELWLKVQEDTADGRQMSLIFRVYNSGIGFRYLIPLQTGPSEWRIKDELTTIKMTGDHKTWWIPADYDSYEHLYSETKLSEVDATPLQKNPSLIASTIKEVHAFNTPVTFKATDSLYISISEAALYDYAEMTLKIGEDKRTLHTDLVPSPQAWKSSISLPAQTPWRTITIGNSAGTLVESDLILTLNEPSKIEDVSWIKPGKYMGIWWGMHLGKNTWEKGPKHGATTANAKKLIDFASKNRIPSILIEGWNTGWENWFDPQGRIDAFDWVTPYDDFNLEEVVAYGKAKNVSLIGHHETSAVVYKYDTMMDAAFAQCEALGIPAVKTGYVGKILPPGEYHHGQWMVEHYQRSVETAARHHVMVDIHEPIKPTGIRRTWPNLMSREGVRGTEFNAWSNGSPPSHITILPFTRGLAGPIDYTPGIFGLTLKPYKPDNQMLTTLANQLAQYIVIYSPIVMAADLQENYEGHPAFQFIRDVPTDWEETKVLDGEIGDFIVTARKGRSSENWFLGAVTDENSREISINLDFLTAGLRYHAVIYSDGPDAHFKDNPGAYQIEEKTVQTGEKMNIRLAPGGGVAVSFIQEK